MSSPDGVEFHAARRLAWEAASVLPSERIPLTDAVGRVLAEDVIALIDVAHYASSAMDGWAVAGPPPWRLVSRGELGPGDAIPIVTGGLVPAAAEAVLRSEHGDAVGGILTPSVLPPPGRHIRVTGEEAGRGDVVIPSGTRLNPAQVAVAAGCGHDLVPVVRRPRVGFVFTGDEVVTSGLPKAGQVRDSFDPLLPATLDLLGAVTVSRIRIGDDTARLLATLNGADADLVVTTGGTGGSAVDHLRPVLDRLGAELVVGGLAVRPGGPTLLARLPEGPLVFGLPGNPLAAMTGLLTLAPPALARMTGVQAPTSTSTIAGEDVSGVPGRTAVVPYRTVSGRAMRCDRTRSGMLRGLAEAEGLLVVPEGGVHLGDPVEVLPLPW